ncbi:hypothetical protein GGD66_000824 [Bradyrhizobium sp. CIR48]|nr:hypothetical protein [Bradyrhizobium sp. CIR48]
MGFNRDRRAVGLAGPITRRNDDAPICRGLRPAHYAGSATAIQYPSGKGRVRAASRWPCLAPGASPSLAARPRQPVKPRAPKSMTESHASALGAVPVSPPPLSLTSLADAFLLAAEPPEHLPCQGTCSPRGARRRTKMQTETIQHSGSHRHGGDGMLITSIERHAGSGMWHGTAVHEGRGLMWYYRPRSWLRVQQQDERNPNCWMNVEPPAGARQVVTHAIRTAKASGMRPQAAGGPS